MDKSYIWLFFGLLLIIVGVTLLIDYVREFGRIVIGILALIIGLQIIGYVRNPRMR